LRNRRITRHFWRRPNKNCKFVLVLKENNMPAATIKKGKINNITLVKKKRDYSNKPAFKKKADNAVKFIKKHGLPESFKKKK